MAGQRAKKKTSISRVSIALTNAVQVYKGEMAAIDTATGLVTIGATSATLVPIGYFARDLLGDGVTEVVVELFREVILHWFDNDAGTPVVAADLLSDCYVLTGSAVTGNAAGASVAGRVWSLKTIDGVGVEIVGMNAG